MKEQKCSRVVGSSEGDAVFSGGKQSGEFFLVYVSLYVDAEATGGVYYILLLFSIQGIK